MADNKESIKAEEPNGDSNTMPKRGKRRAFIVGAFEESIKLAKEIYKLGSGEKVRRLTLFDSIGKSPDSGPSRMMVTMCGKYGLTSGSYKADFLTLTAKGLECVSDDHSPVIALKAKFELSIAEIDVYNFLYQRFVSNKLPSLSVLKDLVLDEYKDREVDDEIAREAIETFIVNLKYLGILQTIAGAERIVSLEHALEQIAKVDSAAIGPSQTVYNPKSTVIDLVQVNSATSAISEFDDFNNICFYITPIGEESSEFRKHSDLFLEAIISPAILPFGLKVIRADQIDKPGTITNQIIEYIFKSRLVIADLSFHNPNVFYELALRHVSRLPTVQIIRRSEAIPFDVSQSRTIVIDTTDIYTLVPKLEIHKAEISSQVRQALAGGEAVDNPLTNVFPKLSLQF